MGAIGGKKPPAGLCATPPTNTVDSKKPSDPPSSEIEIASPRIIPSTLPSVKPNVLRTPTSRTLSRTDIAMVFAETSSVANTTAAQMLRMNAFTLPIIAMKSRLKAFSLSDFVGRSVLRKAASMSFATCGTAVGESASTPKNPTRPLIRA